MENLNASDIRFWNNNPSQMYVHMETKAEIQRFNHVLKNFLLFLQTIS